jgi:hypothetical protein
MMSQRSKREMIESIRPRYLRASKSGKKQILDELVATTGLHRKYAIRVMKHGYKPKGIKKPGRRKVYQGEVVQALEQIWEIYGCICSKRLHPFLSEGITILERCRELTLSAEVKGLLLSMSRATIDRCLKRVRSANPQHGLSTTKPGSLLKQAIPIRTFTPWENEKTGFMEIDLVAHCGSTTEGTYLNTLTATDIATGWTECMALPNKTQQAVSEAIAQMRIDLPFPLLGIDSDNGSEFINETLLRYCQTEQITFTRSRPYQKNDQAHVEQKNWSVVRHTIGYYRLDNLDELAMLKSVYADLRLYINFFQPVLKLIAKERINNKIVRRYDQASTPYRRVLSSDAISLQVKSHLTDIYVHLNPVQLRTSIDTKVDKLWKLSR